MRTNLRRSLVAPFLACLGSALLAPPVHAGPRDLVAAPELLRGDLDALAARWLEILHADPTSLEAQAVLLLWDGTLERMPGARPGSEVWRELRERAGSNGWSERMLAWQLRHQLFREGKFTEAITGVDLTVGSPRPWIGIGPFGRVEAVALLDDFPPEVQFEPRGEYEGTERKVAWRAVHAGNEPRLQPRDEWGSGGAFYYLRARFRSDAIDAALLQSMSAGSYRIWLDGVPIATVDRFRNSLPQVDFRGVRLAPGEHTLLLKCESQAVSILLRAPNGTPIPIADGDPWGTGPDAGATPVDVAPERLATRVLAAEWRAGRLEPDWRLPLAQLLVLEGDALSARALIFEAEEAGTDPAVLATVATSYGTRIQYLPDDWVKNWLDGLWRNVLADPPVVIPVEMAKAAQDLADDRVIDAVQRLERIRAVAPRSLAALLLQADLSAAEEWEYERLEALGALEAASPDHPEVLSRRIDSLRGEGERPEWRLALEERRYRAAPGHRNGVTLATTYAEVGRWEDATRIFAELRAQTGDATRVLRDEVEHASSYRRFAAAERGIAELGARVPDDPDVPELLGDLQWQEGKLAEARLSYLRALALRPGTMELLRKVRFLDCEVAGEEFEEDEFWRPYAIDGAAAIASPPAADRYPKASSVYLVDQAVTRFLPDGGMEDMVHQVVRLDSKKAVEQFSELFVPGEVLDLRVVTPDGKELHPTSGDGRGNYTLPGLETGSFVEFRSIVRRDLETPKEASFGPFYFADTQFESAFHLSEAVLLQPAAWRLDVKEKALSFAPSERDAGPYRERTWRAVEMERREPEIASPPPDHYVPSVRVLAESKWEEALARVAARGAIADTPTPELELAAREILAGVDGRRARVEALYAAVCDLVKTVGFGRNATEVWLLRRGDRNLLLAALLRAAGIDYEMVYAAVRDEAIPYTDWSIPNPSLFSFPLLRIPLEDSSYYYVTAAYRMAAPGRIPYAYQGGRAVLARPDGGEWFRLPRHSLESEATGLDATVDLGAGAGVARIDAMYEDRSLEISGFKEQVQNFNESRRTQTLEGFAQGILPGARLISGAFVDPEKRTGPFRMQVELETAGLVTPGEKGSMLKTNLFLSQMRRSFATKGERSLPFFYGRDALNWSTTSFDLGGRYRLVQIPEDLELCGPWGTYQISYSVTGGRIVVRRRLELRPFEVPAAEYGGLLDLATAIDRKEEERIVLAQIAP